MMLLRPANLCSRLCSRLCPRQRPPSMDGVEHILMQRERLAGRGCQDMTLPLTLRRAKSSLNLYKRQHTNDIICNCCQHYRSVGWIPTTSRQFNDIFVRDIEQHCATRCLSLRNLRLQYRKQPWFGTGNVPWKVLKVTRPKCLSQISTEEHQGDQKDTWVTILSEERNRMYLVVTKLDPRTKMLSLCDNKYLPSSCKRRAQRFSFHGV